MPRAGRLWAMRLRTQLAVAFFLLAVVPLLGVTLYSWWGSQRAFRRGVEAEAGSLASEMSSRVEALKDELAVRLQRMGQRPSGARGSPFEVARREALAAAERQELRALLGTIPSSAGRAPSPSPWTPSIACTLPSRPIKP